MDWVRVDRWLCAARIYKSRTQASDACGGGHVSVNGATVRASHPVRIGDRVRALAPRGQVVLEVAGIEDKRQSPARARELYVDHSPPPPPREARVAIRPRGAGRPTKAERRATDKLRGD
jgi:ribosome-associated heat shock protein Hsp15